MSFVSSNGIPGIPINRHFTHGKHDYVYIVDLFEKNMCQTPGTLLIPKYGNQVATKLVVQNLQLQSRAPKP